MSEKEVSLYQAEEAISKSKDPLAWWRDNSQFKILSQLDGKFFSVPATSVPAERLFSKAGTVVCKKRAALQPKNIDRLLFLHSKLK